MVIIPQDLHRLLKVTNEEVAKSDVFAAQDLGPRGSLLQELFGEGGVDATLKQEGIRPA